MREIKFRVWNKKEKKMQYYDTDIVPNITLNGVLISSQKALIDGKETIIDGNVSAEYELMQYIGIKDKNGVEIYESDLVTRNGIDGKVQWDDLEARFRVYCGNINYPVDTSWIVTGNEYE